ncbi:MAG TPA: glycoside hydrolase family 31 protein [Opitutaceae bacterium]|nr:glycoside hydrolase family 31 protein [Opitutaceae bacterium]
MRARLMLLGALLLAGPASAGPRPVGDVTGVVRHERGLALACADGAVVHLQVLAPDLVRVRTLFAGQAAAPDHSWAVARTDWAPVEWEVSETAATVTLTTPELAVEVRRAPLLVTFRDRASGRVLNADARPMARDPQTGRVTAAKRLGFDEHFYGLGEKAARLDRRRGRFELWNSDTPGYTEGTDPIYQSIPFYLGWEAGEAYGLFYDNPARSRFDFGHSGQEAVEYEADGGILDFYFFRGPAMKRILGRYTELTGRMPLPPRWALGHQQSRYSYYPAAMVEEVARQYRARRLPLDALYLDIHYMSGYRVFTWDPERFPDPDALTRRLAADGVKLVAIIDPGVKHQPPAVGAPPAPPRPELSAATDRYYVFDEGLARDFFLRRRDGSLYVGEVWPGPAVFVDYTREDARRWWGGLQRALVDHGVAGIWNDMNEPSDFRDKTGESQRDVVFEDLGARTEYPHNRNTFALNMSRASYEGLAALRPNQRPFVITRAGYAGIQRYATVWTGDNNATFDSLALNVPMFASLGLSGEAFVGSDFPGFIGRGDGELLVRSYQLATFVPLSRNHGAIDQYDHEPWRYGRPYEDIVRRYLELRYQLLPLLYTALEESHRTGVPLFRPLLLNFQDDPSLLNLDDEYMVGDALLVAPVTRAGERGREVYLPHGRWYDYWTAAVLDGGRLERVAVPLEHLPIYVRGGAIVPSTVAMQHTGERPWDPVRFDVYPDEHGAAAGELYEDDGESPAYLQGAFRRTRLECATADGATVLTLEAPVGPYQPPKRTFELVLHVPGPGARVTLDGAPADGAEATPTTVRLRLPDDGRPHTLRLLRNP